MATATSIPPVPVAPAVILELTAEEAVDLRALIYFTVCGGGDRRDRLSGINHALDLAGVEVDYLRRHFQGEVQVSD
jgi:hypothetical protein